MRVTILGSRPYKVSAEQAADGIEKTGFVYFARNEDANENIKFSSTEKHEKGAHELNIEMVDVRPDGSAKYREIIEK